MDAERVTVDIEAGGMRAVVAIADGPKGEDDILAALTAADVRTGVDTAMVERLQARLGNDSFAVQGLTVAVGVDPIDGEDERVELELTTDMVAGARRPDGSLDYRERAAITDVKAGQTLGRWFAPTAGTPGETVSGVRLPARPGASLELLGDGVEVDPATGTLRATRDGALVYLAGRRVAVTDLVELEHDVDYASGNVHTTASVRIKGGLHPGFQVDSAADVQVDGIVDDARIDAGADVFALGGVIGREFGRIVAGGDVRIRHAAHARIQAGGTLTISDHAVDSSLSADRVEATEGRGAIVGGTVRARESIRARTAGARHETTTELRVAVAITERRELRKQQAALERRSRTTQRRRTDGTRHARGKAARADRQVGKRSVTLRREERRLRAIEDSLLNAAVIEIAQSAFAGVRIRFGRYQLQLEQTHTATRFRFDSSTRTIRAENLRS